MVINGWSQTARINLEKHHLSTEEVSSAQNHNFGIPSDYELRSMYDTLEYFKNGCIIAHKKYKLTKDYKDTLCEIDFVQNYEASTDEINERMLGGHEMVNFDQYEKERKIYLQKTKKSGLPWYYALFFIAFLPFIPLKKDEI